VSVTPRRISSVPDQSRISGSGRAIHSWSDKYLREDHEVGRQRRLRGDNGRCRLGEGVDREEMTCSTTRVMRMPPTFHNTRSNLSADTASLAA
jgi:hypothetical protein